MHGKKFLLKTLLLLVYRKEGELNKQHIEDSNEKYLKMNMNQMKQWTFKIDMKLSEE
jgi:hypothetical protein